MKAYLIEYKKGGEILKKTSLEVHFAYAEEPPSIEIWLPDKKKRLQVIQFSAKQLLSLIMGRILDMMAKLL